MAGLSSGAAVLSIKAGDTKPTVVAGTSTPNQHEAAVSAMSLPPVATKLIAAGQQLRAHVVLRSQTTTPRPCSAH